VRKRIIRIIVGYLIGIMPTNRLRCFLYRTVFGYRIHQSRIGWKTIIVVEDAELIECRIARHNHFIGPMSVVIQRGTTIGDSNTFDCGWWTQEEQYKTAGYERYLRIGENTLITSKHHFDVVGSFVLGNGSWIAGCGSQFWTHGAGVRERNISIGEYCYIGSAVRFAPGSSVGNNSIVSLGSVVTREFKDENVIIGGQSAKVLRENYDWRTQKDMCQQGASAEAGKPRR